MLSYLLGIRGRQWSMLGLIFVATYMSNGSARPLISAPQPPIARFSPPAEVPAPVVSASTAGSTLIADATSNSR